MLGNKRASGMIHSPRMCLVSEVNHASACCSSAPSWAAAALSDQFPASLRDQHSAVLCNYDVTRCRRMACFAFYSLGMLGDSEPIV
jgi:hypothetical protein